METKKILIADSSSSCRSIISKTLVHYGAKTSNIQPCSTYHQAIEEFNTSHPSLIVAEYFLGTYCGLDLINVMKEVYQDERDRLFIIATANASESAVVESAEESVDSFILKPFTGNSLKDIMFRALMEKINPPPYMKIIHHGKELMSQDRLDDAEQLFIKAKDLSEKPALANYYLGELALKQDEKEKAVTAFRDGLEANESHYKCLVGLYETLESLKRKPEAYKSVQKLVEMFPVSPNRLGRIIRLAVETRSFQDIDKYYNIFTRLAYRPDELVKTISAALIVGGRFYLKDNNAELAFQVFNKAAVSSARNPTVLRQIIGVLVEYEEFTEAEKFLKMFDSSFQGTDDYKTLDFIISAGVDSPENVVEKGRKWINEGVQSFEIFDITIQKLIEIGREGNVESIAYEAMEKFPDKKEYFMEYIE